MDKGLAKMNTGQGDFDLLIGMNVWALGRSIASKLVRPLNLDYIPNLAANNWDTFQSPFYDVGSHYSTPYSVWSTGIFWRNDQDHPGHRRHGEPLRHLLERRARGQDAPARQRAGRVGDGDVPRGDHRREQRRRQATITTAKDAIQRSSPRRTPRSTTSTTRTCPKGRACLHQSWSGNVSDAFVFLKASQASQADNLSYIWPVGGRRAGQRRQRPARGPQLGQEPGALAPAGEPHHGREERDDELHHLDRLPDAAEDDDPRGARGHGLVPEHLANVYIQESDMDRGSRELELPAIGGRAVAVRVRKS